ncbi:MAG: hypothetical protein ACLQDY_05900 [Streptosporangiaceae bacterium]
MQPSEQRLLGQVTAELSRLARYDDESVVHDTWIRQRYDSGGFATYAPARTAVVRTAWHEAGHAVAALAVGARFSSASVRHGRDSGGRVHNIQGSGDLAFVVAAAGQVAERLADWTTLDRDDELRAWLTSWRSDGGDARQFRSAVASVPGQTEVSAWRWTEAMLTPRRPEIRQVARALMAWPRHLPSAVIAAIAADARPQAADARQ